jgi:hypothetical protein
MTAYGVTSVYVTAASFDNWRWTNFVSEGLEHKIDELVESSIYGYPDEPPSHQGLTTAEGDIDFEPNPMAIGQYIRGTFGVASRTVLCAPGSTGANSGAFAGDGVYQWEFTPRASAFDNSCYQDPYQLLVYRDVGSAFVFQDAVFTKFGLNLQAGQLLKGMVTAMGRRVTRVALSAVASLVSSGGEPWVWDAASVQIGPGVNSLAGFTYFEAINPSFEVPIEGVPLLDGTRFYGEMQKSDFVKTRFSGTLSFRDQTQYDQFIAYNNVYLRITLRNVSSVWYMGNPASVFYHTLQIDVPQFKTTKYGVFVKNPQRITADFEGRGERDNALGYAIKATLITNVNSF